MRGLPVGRLLRSAPSSTAGWPPRRARRASRWAWPPRRAQAGSSASGLVSALFGRTLGLGRALVAVGCLSAGPRRSSMALPGLLPWAASAARAAARRRTTGRTPDAEIATAAAAVHPEPRAGLVEAQPDLGDRRSGDQDTGQHVRHRRPQPQPERHRGVAISGRRVRTSVGATGSAARAMRPAVTRRSTVPRGGRCRPSTPTTGAGRTGSTGTPATADNVRCTAVAAARPIPLLKAAVLGFVVRTAIRPLLAEDAGFEPARALTQPAFQATPP